MTSYTYFLTSPKQVGSLLHDRVFRDHFEILNEFARCSGAVSRDKDLRLQILGDRVSLRTPYESIYDPSSKAGGSYLIETHPLTRALDGIVVDRESCTPAWISGLSARREDLRILLVASDTGGIPGVDEEVRSLAQQIPAWFAKAGVSTTVDAFGTDDLSAGEFEKLLREGGYHILHYAGHGSHESHAERSAMFMWSGKTRRPPVLTLAVPAIADMVQGTELRFMYLSCCHGTASAPPSALVADDFLGFADGVVRAGVPGVLGFRRSVSDAGALEFSGYFYEALAQHGDLEVALLRARQQAKAWGPDDPTWLTPILIRQDVN